jgi:hypothetical protein
VPPGSAIICPSPEGVKARVRELLSAFDVPQARYVQELVETEEIVMEFRRVHWLLVQPPWFRAASCWSATQYTLRRRTSEAAPAWQWRMRRYWPTP